MAIQNSPLKKASLFSPELFADPETLSQISQVENPPAAAPPSPAAMDQIPMRGAVPQSFTEWAIDPMNLSKIAPPAPRNTPMPSVVAQKAAAAADAGFLQPVTTAPPIESSKPQPSLEDSLMAPAPESSVIKGPPSRQDFFASLPGGHAAIPGPPPSYQGKKLAAMGLFTALDTIGAALTHGEPTVGPGLIRNAQALAEYKRSLPATQTAADTAAYEQSLKEGGEVGGIEKTGLENQNLRLFGPPQQRKAQFVAQLQQDAQAGKVQPSQLRQNALRMAQVNGINIAPEEIDSVLSSTKPVGPKYTVLKGEKGVFEGLQDRQGNIFPPNGIPNDPDAQALAKSAQDIHKQLVGEEVDKETRVASVAAERQAKSIEAAINAANQGEANKTLNTGREQAIKHLNEMRASQNQLKLVQDLASSTSPTDQTSLAFKALGLDLPDGVHRINETELNAIRNQGSLSDRAYRALLNWTSGQQFAPDILKDISATATKIANSKIKNANDNLRDVNRVYGYKVAGAGHNGGLDEAPEESSARGSLAKAAKGQKGPVAPATHVFSLGAWKNANPNGDAEAAKKAAVAAGYKVID